MNDASERSGVLLRNPHRRSIVVIPARMRSERLPGKPLLEAAGKSLVRWTYEQAKKTDADYVIVGTPDREIARHCQDNGMTWMVTSGEHANGTSRCMETYSRLRPEVKACVRTVVNWQVDEPLIPPGCVDGLLRQRMGSIGTLVHPTVPLDSDRNQVKVVYSHNKCHWFSRAPMRGAGVHVGVYAFCPFLLQMVSLMKVSKHAEAEGLEQLTWVENGIVINPTEIETLPLSINSAEDWERFKAMKEGRMMGKTN